MPRRLSKFIDPLIFFLFTTYAVAGASASLNKNETLILQVQLDSNIISESLVAYDHKGNIFVPLGELTHALGIAIDLDKENKVAKGWILDPDRTFELDLKASTVLLSQKSEAIDPENIVSMEDVFVPASLFSKWFPVDLDVDKRGLILHVVPREPLPLQGALERLKLSNLLKRNQPMEDPGYPRIDIPYETKPPFIDQRVDFGTDKTNGVTSLTGDYTTYASGDFLGMESMVLLSGNNLQGFNNPLWTMGRYDYDGQLLGDLHARQVGMGTVLIPGHPEIVFPKTDGIGASVSNRPATLPNQFANQNFKGTLQPGWDVQLFQNGILAGYQQAPVNGQYEFDDLPLLYGVNDFALIFHGPLGQEIEEHSIYFLDPTLVKPGEIFYDLGATSTTTGNIRANAQFDASLSSHIFLTGSALTLPVANLYPHSYGAPGIRTLWSNIFLSGDTVFEDNGGTLYEAGLKTRLGGVLVTGSHAILNNFQSDVFLPAPDPIQSRSKLRLDMSIPLPKRLPFSVIGQRDLLLSTTENYDVLYRVSTFMAQTSFTYQLHTQYLGSATNSDVSVIAGRHFEKFGLRGSLDYLIDPQSEFNTANVICDTPLSRTYLLTQTAGYTFNPSDLAYTVALNKMLGEFALGTTLGYSTSGNMSVGVQLFLALGVDPRKNNVFIDARPMAQLGTISAKTFIDKNNNGIMDIDEKPMSGIGYTIDGNKKDFRTDKEGLAILDHLVVRQPLNLAIDSGTVEDFHLTPSPRGAQVVLRPGRVAEIDLPLIPTIEIDGKIFSKQKGKPEIPAGGINIQLVDTADSDRVVSETKSASDGFYVLPSVPSGKYRIRISQEDLERISPINVEFKVGDLISVTPNSPFIHNINGVLNLR